MAADGFFLTQQDRDDLREVLRGFRSAREARPRYSLSGGLDLEHQDMPAPEAYVAFTPTEGITALTTRDGVRYPGYADCTVYRVNHIEPEPYLDEMTDLVQTVFNTSDSDVPGDSWILIVRDKFGAWVAVTTEESFLILLIDKIPISFGAGASTTGTGTNRPAGTGGPLGSAGSGTYTGTGDEMVITIHEHCTAPYYWVKVVPTTDPCALSYLATSVQGGPDTGDAAYHPKGCDLPVWRFFTGHGGANEYVERLSVVRARRGPSGTVMIEPSEQALHELVRLVPGQVSAEGALGYFRLYLYSRGWYDDRPCRVIEAA